MFTFSKFRLYRFALAPTLNHLRFIAFLVYLFIFYITVSLIFISVAFVNYYQQFADFNSESAPLSSLFMVQSNEVFLLKSVSETKILLPLTYNLCLLLFVVYLVGFFLIFRFHVIFLQTININQHNSSFFFKSSIFADLVSLVNGHGRLIGPNFLFLFWFHFYKGLRDFLFLMYLPSRRFISYALSLSHIKLILFILNYFSRILPFYLLFLVLYAYYADIYVTFRDLYLQDIFQYISLLDLGSFLLVCVL